MHIVDAEVRRSDTGVSEGSCLGRSTQVRAFLEASYVSGFQHRNPSGSELHTEPASVATGFPFPLPWYYIPLNLYVLICLIYTLIFSPPIKRVSKARSEVGITSVIPSLKGYVPDIHYICPALSEIDFPLHVPSNVTLCGPILTASESVAKVDPDLLDWLKGRSTVLINLGSHVVSGMSDAQQIAIGIRVAIAGHPELQILWKHTIDEKDEKTKSILADEIACGRVKIQKWLRPDPTAILQTGSVICSVHHGGANSFYEATKYVCSLH